MSEMIQRLVVAMKASKFDHSDFPDDVLEKIARENIAAMREPTEAMIEKGILDSWSIIEAPLLKDAWRSMIDEALK